MKTKNIILFENLYNKKFYASDVIMKRKCKKSIYKSTYKKNAFTKNRIYICIEENDNFLYFIDNEGKKFSISKNSSNSFYWLEDYFL